MTETEITPPVDTMTLAEAFALVEVTPGDAIGVLNSLAEGFTDKHPTLSTSLNAAILLISKGDYGSKSVEEADESEVVTEDSPPV